MKLIDLTGKRFGRLTVIKRAEDHIKPSGKKVPMWLCQCDCGNTTVVRGYNLRGGNIRSCGCLLNETIKTCHLTHGESKSRLYRIWADMKQRCTNPNRPRYPLYGGRGITVCDEWANSFEAFHNWAIQNGYDPLAERGKCTIERIDCDGNYEPSNCKWATMKEQCLNRHPKGYLNEKAIETWQA